jgi:hypothetical protein
MSKNTRQADVQAVVYLLERERKGDETILDVLQRILADNAKRDVANHQSA